MELDEWLNYIKTDTNPVNASFFITNVSEGNINGIDTIRFETKATQEASIYTTEYMFPRIENGNILNLRIKDEYESSSIFQHLLTSISFN